MLKLIQSIDTVNQKRYGVIKMNALQCKMARVALGLGVRDLAQLAQVATGTVTRLEGGEELKPRTVQAIRTALETAGVEFIPENGGGVGVRLCRK